MPLELKRLPQQMKNFRWNSRRAKTKRRWRQIGSQEGVSIGEGIPETMRMSDEKQFGENEVFCN